VKTLFVSPWAGRVVKVSGVKKKNGRVTLMTKLVPADGLMLTRYEDVYRNVRKLQGKVREVVVVIPSHAMVQSAKASIRVWCRMHGFGELRARGKSLSLILEEANIGRSKMEELK
jgi:hypothetical protein